MDEQDLIEYWQERSAIIQYDAGKSRPDAEFYAAVLMGEIARRRGIVITDRWLRILTMLSQSSSVWSDENGGPVHKVEPYLPPQFRGKSHG